MPSGDYGWIEKGLDDPNYSVENDEEELKKTYVCKDCQSTFTLREAIDEYSSRMNGDLSYTTDRYAGDLCGYCAADHFDEEAWPSE